MQWAQKQTGFTVVELLIVIVVIAILATITLVSYNGIQRQAQQAAVTSDIRSIDKVVEAHYLFTRAYPGSITDCPVPAPTNLCYSQGGATTVTYGAIAPGTSSYTTVVDPSYEVSVEADLAFGYYSPAVKTGVSEFMQYTDLAPYIDTYGLVPYVLSFDIRSAGSGTGSVTVYFQNGSSARYGGLSKMINITGEWERHTVEFTPSIATPSDTKSMLAFYGSYGTGKIPSIRNVRFELKP